MAPLKAGSEEKGLVSGGARRSRHGSPVDQGGATARRPSGATADRPNQLSGGCGCQGPSEDVCEGGEGGLVEVVGAASDGVEHVPLGALGAADSLLVVGVGVDGLRDAPPGAAPGGDALVVVIQAGQGVALALGH